MEETFKIIGAKITATEKFNLKVEHFPKGIDEEEGKEISAFDSNNEEEKD